MRPKSHERYSVTMRIRIESCTGWAKKVTLRRYFFAHPVHVDWYSNPNVLRKCGAYTLACMVLNLIKNSSRSVAVRVKA